MKVQTKIALGAALSVFAMPAFAQNPASDSAEERANDALGIDDIVVTASPRGANKLDSSISVSSLSTDVIAQSAPRTTAEIFRALPGIRSESTGGDGNANIAVRGLPVASGGAKFLQLQEDGLPVMQFGDIAFGNADIFLRADQTVSRIEAVRGGSASTFASNAPGGVINFISKDGRQEGGTVMATVGVDYEEYRLDFNYGGKLSENTRFNIGGFWRQGEGPRRAGYTANDGFQIKANLTHEFENGYIRIYAKHLNDKAIGYLPMPTRVTGSNSDPSFGSVAGFNIQSDTPHSAYFTSDVGLDGNNNLRTTDITDGMNPVVSSIGFEAAVDVSETIRLENRFRWSDVGGRFVSPFPADVGSAQGIANSTGNYLTTGSFDLPTGTAQPAYALRYATGPQAGQAFNNSNGLLMRTHLFNVEINDFGSFTNDLKLVADAGPATLTGGLYMARQNIDMDWLWNSYLMEVKGNNAALVNVVSPTGTVLSQNGLYAYGVPFWGNCCTRSYDASYNIIAPYANIGAEFGSLNFDASARYDTVRARGTYAGALQVTNRDVNGDGTIQAVERSVSTLNNAAPNPVNYNVGYLSWSVGANYRINDDMAVFGRISRGARANADRLLFGVVLPDGSVRKDDAIDFVTQAELGAKYRSGGLQVFATLFHARTQEQNFEATSQRFLDRTYRATGLELEGSYTVGIFDLRAGMTYTDAKIASDAISPANEGNTPRRQAKFIYQFTPSVNLDVAKFGLNVIGTSKAFAQDNNALVFPAFAQVNAFASFRPTDRVELSLNANNLFNTIGITEAEEGSITSGVSNIIRARSINGRTISASVRFDF